ncbi:MAG: ACT domain-containing protein [Acidobacteriota bacterium]
MRRARSRLQEELAVDLSRRDVEEIVVRPAVTLVAAVGAGMARTPGVAARVFSAVAGATVNVLAIAQGSSELNITVAVDARDDDAAVRALHRALGLHQRDTGEETAGGLDVLILGAGRIGRAVAVLAQARRVLAIQERFGLTARARRDRRFERLRPRPRGLRDADLARVLEGKKGGLPIAALPDATASSDSAAASPARRSKPGLARLIRRRDR